MLKGVLMETVPPGFVVLPHRHQFRDGVSKRQTTGPIFIAL